MKYNILLSLLLLIYFESFGQADSIFNTYPIKDGRIVFEKIDTIHNSSKDVIYAASKKWFSDTFKSGKSVIQSEDATSGQIIGVGYTNVIVKEVDAYNLTRLINYKFSTQVDAKEGKYRIRFYDIQVHTESSGRYFPETDTPLESLYATKKPIKSKRKLQQAIVSAETTQNHFNTLLRNFKESITKSSADTF